jgi:mono/diheme cytochrome c family protein
VQKILIRILYNIGNHSKRWGVLVALGIAALIAILLLHSTPWFFLAYYKVLTDDSDRDAKVMAVDSFGDKFSKVVYLEQGWTRADSLWFYNITQGADFLPYDMFLALEQANSQDLFRSDENMNRYRYLPQKQTKSNPDGLPVGMVADTYRGKKYMGFTCAACHTSQLNFNGVGIRIDGGPSAADMDTFLHELAAALKATRDDPAKNQRFVAALLKAGSYRNTKEVEDELGRYALRVDAYNFINQTTAPYGYARLDAFGRIYNRVAEHVMNGEALRMVLVDLLSPDELDIVLAKLKPVLSDKDRDRVMGQLASALSSPQLMEFRKKVFNSPNAPVSYPFLWDIPQHDYVQWNGIGANANLGPQGRNTGEVIGVFATLDWEERERWSLRSLLAGQGLRAPYIRFQSSIKAHNLKQIENRLWDLQSPQWTDAVAKAGLPGLDAAKLKRGERLYDQMCARCHARIERASVNRRVVAQMDKLCETGTDPTMANNSVDDIAYSGILRNEYAKITEAGNILLDTKAPVAALLTKATENVVATPDPDKWFFTRGADWAIDLISAYFKNQIKPSIKSGDYIPDTTAMPYESLRAYKGRPLNGIWATAPYLHNGSVPTLYDLLLPASRVKNDPADMTYRPQKFMVGSREFDAKRVGFRKDPSVYSGFLFDTTLPSNSNAGHEYGTRSLTDDQRWDLVEYLKSL